MAFGATVVSAPVKFMTRSITDYFVILAVCFFLAAWWLRNRRIRSRIERGLCPSCGYLMASADRCPECGSLYSRYLANRRVEFLNDAVLEPLPRFRLRNRLLLWGMLFIVCVIGVSAKAWHDRKVQSAKLQWDETRLQREQSAARIRALFDSRSPPSHWTRQELARELSAGSLPTTQRSWYQVGVWTDPQSGRVFEFKFDKQDGWIGYPSQWSSSGFTPPRAPAVLRVMEPLRGQIAGRNIGWGPLLWIALLILFPFARRYRAIVAELLLFVAVLTSLAWLLKPNYSISPRGILSNDMLFWGAIMLVVSGVIFRRALSLRLRLDPRFCRTCGYDLTGNVSGVCPECGTAISPTPAIGLSATKSLAP